MREIKFRGRTNEFSSPSWVYGDLICDCTDEPRIMTDYHDCYEPTTWLVDPDTVGQFTGLCDCKEQWIFEGDVLEVSIFDYAGCDTRYKVSVDWYNGNFWCNALFVKALKNWERLNPEKAGAWLLSDVLDNDCEAVIVGNVYDNPQLLKEGGGDA